jgi:hypothetical protein
VDLPGKVKIIEYKCICLDKGTSWQREIKHGYKNETRKDLFAIIATGNIYVHT